MKQLFIFTLEARGTIYGVGTYVKQLTDCLKERSDIIINEVRLHSKEKEFKIERNESFNTLYLPQPTFPISTDLQYERYYRNCWFVLRDYIQKQEITDFLFHLNYFEQYPFISLMKDFSPSSPIFFTIHYFEWCFLIDGNLQLFRKIISTEKTKIMDSEQTEVYDSYKKEKRILQQIDHIICLSKFTWDLLINEYDITDGKISLIPNGLKDSFIGENSKQNELRKKYFFSEDEKLILFAGRLDKVKGVDILINAFKIILTKENNCRLIIIGDGNFSTYMKECEDFWGKIVFTGRLEQNKLYEFYQIADVGVMPSTHEQCSYVAIEMMMFGLPLITSTTTGLKEMLDEEISNKIEITESLQKIEISSLNVAQLILQKIERKKSYPNIYRETYLQKYSIDSMCHLVSKLYT